MERQGSWRLGGICAMVAGVLYMAVLPLSVLPLVVTGESPAALGEADSFFTLMNKVPLAFVGAQLGFGLAEILALAVVPALQALVESGSPAVMRWLSTIAYLGFGVGAVSSIHGTQLSVRVAATYATGDPAVRATIAAAYPPAALTLDGWSLLMFGGIGLWILVVCLLARRQALLPSGLVYLGIGVCVLYWVGIVGDILPDAGLSGIGGGLGIVAGGAWFVWIGRTLLRRAGQATLTPGHV